METTPAILLRKTKLTGTSVIVTWFTAARALRTMACLLRFLSLQFPDKCEIPKLPPISHSLLEGV